MTCSVLPVRDFQPHSQLALRRPLPAGGAGLTVTLCPATCSLTEMVMDHLGESRRRPFLPSSCSWAEGIAALPAAAQPTAVGNGRTYPVAKSPPSRAVR